MSRPGALQTRTVPFAPARIRTVELVPEPAAVRRLQTSLDELAPARVIRWREDRATGFNVVHISPPGAVNPAFIVPMSFDYRIDPLVTKRLQVLAAVSGAPVVGVDTPGVTMNAVTPKRTGRTRVPFIALWHAAKGDYSGFAQLQLAAVAQAAGVDPAGSRLLGESLGAQLVASMAKIAHPASVDLIEPVNVARRPLRQLPGLWRALQGPEKDLRERYIAQSVREGWQDVSAFETSSPENAEVDARLKRFSRQGRWAFGSAIGLRRPLSLTLADVNPEIPVRLWRAADSLVCDPNASAALIAHLARDGTSAELTTMTLPDGRAGHHVLTSLSAMTAFGRLLA